MGTEKAGSWLENEHTKEKKEVLGKVENKLEGKNLAKEIPDLITGISKFRYPQDAEPPVRESKKTAFKSALVDVASICRTDADLKKYDIKKEDILSWCRVPILENGDPPNVWENMSKRSGYGINHIKDYETTKMAESKMALSTAFSKIGLSDELMPHCRLKVTPRDPDSFTDMLSGLPKPNTKEKTYFVFMEFNIGQTNMKIEYDSSNPADIRMEGIVGMPGYDPYYLGAMMTLGPDKKIAKYAGKMSTLQSDEKKRKETAKPHMLLGEGGTIDRFLKLAVLAQEEKKE